MKLYSIASGSSGNSIFVGEEKGVLVDAGISMKRIMEGLEQEKISIEQIEGILITHEHSDHASGLGPLLRKYEIPVYGTEKTLQSILASDKMKKVNTDLFFPVVPDKPVTVAGMEIVPFSISHDAVDPVCYTIEREGKKVSVATDMGSFSDYTVSHISGSAAMLLEANHDINMLQVGRYPYQLKMRILGDKGHLSNDSSARLIERVLHDKLRCVMLGHLSQENNLPDLAYQTVKYELEQLPQWEDVSTELSVARRTQPTPAVMIN